MPAPKYPPPLEGIPRITNSTLNLYLKCGLRWWMEKQQPDVRWATVRMLIGTGLGAGALADNRSKMDRGTAATIGDITDAAVAAYEIEAGASEVPEPKTDIATGKDSTAEAARVFALQVSPQTPGVIEAERPLLAVLRGIQLAGTPDVVTDSGIGDYKTGQPWTQARADASRQLTAYSILRRVNSNRHNGSGTAQPRRVWIDSISHSAKGWTAQRWWSTRNNDDMEAFLQVMTRAVAGMQAGVALPAAENSWHCSAKWCPQWKRCPAVNAGRKGI